MRSMQRNTIVGLLLATMVGAGSLPAIPQSPESATAKAIFGGLLSLDTTHDKGTVAAVEVLRSRFAAAGFAPADLPSSPLNLELRVTAKEPT